MSQPIEVFFQAWSLEDASARTDRIQSSVTETCTYADPRCPEPIVGPVALSEYVGQFSANAPGWSAEVVHSDSNGGMTRATVAFQGPGPDGKKVVQHGQYFVEHAGDKISKLVGFAGMGSPES